LAGKPYISQR
jgi:hypothetical protein